MHGNMAEWTADFYVYDLEGGTDPWRGEGNAHTVYRGGSDHRTPRRLRSAYRAWMGDGGPYTGLRLARSE